MSNSIVNRQEAMALKEMIFKRARERAEALDNDVKNSYTDDVQNDVMDLARESFNSPRNPFAQVAQKDETTQKNEIGFKQRSSEQIQKQLENSSKSANNEITRNTINNTMADAHANFAKKESFIGALNFLNAQASIALIKSGGKNFDAIA